MHISIIKKKKRLLSLPLRPRHISNGGAHELPPPIAAPGRSAPPPRASPYAAAEARHPGLSSTALRGGGDRGPRRAPRPAAAALRQQWRLVHVERRRRRRGGASAVAVAVAVAGGLGDRAARPPRRGAEARCGCGSRGGSASLPRRLLRPRRRQAQGLGPRLLQQLQPIPVLRGGERDRVPVRRVPGVLAGDTDEEREARHRPPCGGLFRLRHGSGFCIPFDLRIVIGNSPCWRLGLQLGNRPLSQHGKWLDCDLLPRVLGVCSQLPHLCLQSLQPGPIAPPEVPYTYTSVHLMTCSRYNSYGTLLMLLHKLRFSRVYCVTVYCIL